ncbi:hypothetical protein [Bythopirellula goksoeyrii]|uniref:Uncharacterized protein n=1 Tax=Bythopirellula goksoeyrii TaxID=1400387 RepID=A0A5B9QGY9_9BACT|nr:hypothetical protein [Bythopirellula goksoeyrii]QEG36216.1 hypothetical protein Pr1d_35280 [Bythopirellula goksoeyrii]
MPTTARPPDPSPLRRKAAEYAARDLAVLRHVYRNGVALNATVSESLFGGKEAGHVFRRFGDRNWLNVQGMDLPGGLSYATLTAAGGKEIGREIKPKQPGPVALDAAIAVAYYCLLEKPGSRRYRLLPEEMKTLKAGLAANVPHIVTEEFGEPVVLRVFQATTGKPAAVRNKALSFFERALADKRQAAWVRSGQLGLVLLGHTPERVAQLEKSLAADARFGGYKVQVGLGPTAETLARCLRERRKKS